MSATFEWTVQSMSSYPQFAGETDVVFLVNWNCTGVQDSGGTEYTSTYIGSTAVTYTAGSTYTPYDQLTQTQVIGWVQAALDAPIPDPASTTGGTLPGHGVADVEAKIQSAIDNQINPPVLYLPLPWAPQPTLPAA